MNDLPISITSIVKGKRVAIVGNATALLGHNYGPLIDSYDVVIRLNRGLSTKPSAQGTKFDLWCFSTSSLIRKELEFYPHVPAVWMSPKKREECYEAFDCIFYSLLYWGHLKEKLGARPSVGCMTVDMITRASPKEVGVFGFDFKKSGTFYQIKQHYGPHDYSAEENFILQTCEIFKWDFFSCSSIP